MCPGVRCQPNQSASVGAVMTLDEATLAILAESELSVDTAGREDLLNLAVDRLFGLLEGMLTIRMFEDRVRALAKASQLPGFVHLSIGQEASAVGVCACLRVDDHITSTHRGHGHVIAKGGDLYRMFAELLGRADGYCRGRGGSMHLVALEIGVLGTNGIVGGGIPSAVGAAWADAALAKDKLSVAFFGDGAANQGVLFESMNLAQIWTLPVVFVCENNGYAEWTPAADLTAGDIAERARGFGIETHQVDGNDVLAVACAAARATRRAHNGEGPTFIEARTYRLEGHLVGEEGLTKQYRPTGELELWHQRDPIDRYQRCLLHAGIATNTLIESIRTVVAQRVESALEIALNSPPPESADATKYVFSAS